MTIFCLVSVIKGLFLKLQRYLTKLVASMKGCLSWLWLVHACSIDCEIRAIFLKKIEFTLNCRYEFSRVMGALKAVFKIS